MIIEKIVLENFQCYYGEKTLEFIEGINVIIGSNGYGKSKLYDAFYWVMYDKIFNSQSKQFIPTSEAKSGLISDKAIAETANGAVQTVVSITFYKDAEGPRFTLQRKYEIKINDGVIKQSTKSEFQISKKDRSYMSAKLVTDQEEIDRILERILPGNIKDYLWFQGEQVESIIDFNQQDTLEKAINALSDMKRYDEIMRIAESAAKHGKSEFEKETKRFARNSEDYEQKLKERDRISTDINHLEQEIVQSENNLAKAENHIQALAAKFEDSQEIVKLEGEKKQILQNLKTLTETQDDQQNKFYRKMFKSSWILKGTESLAHDYEKIFDAYNDKKIDEESTERAKKLHTEELNRQFTLLLPVDVPEPIHIRKMLEVEKCLVCDRDAKKGSAAYQRLEEHLKRSESHQVSRSVNKNDFSGEFKKLYRNCLEQIKIIKSIDETINETLESKIQLQRRIKSQNDELDSISAKIETLLSINALDSDSSKGIVDTYTIQVRNAQKYRDEITLKEQRLKSLEELLNTIQEQLDKNVSKLPEYLKSKYDTLIDFEKIAGSTRGRVFQNLITKLEDEANMHYVDMTQGNKASRGKIKLQKRGLNYMPEIVDSEGRIMGGLNTSNLILVKLSAIMAIVSAKSHSGTAYSLITDAPTSVFGEDYTIGFCKTISKVYKQSIVMSKEFYQNENLKKQLLTNPDIKLGKVYQITPSLKEEERENRDNLETNITPIN